MVGVEAPERIRLGSVKLYDGQRATRWDRSGDVQRGRVGGAQDVSAARSGAVTPLGLSKDHICTVGQCFPSGQEGRAVVLSYTDGSLVSFKREPGRYWSRPLKGRGCVHGFSARSRGRMLRLLAMLRRESLPLFVTLTYPAVWSGDHREWKRNLHAFGEWLRRWSGGRASAVWKLELQDRSAPHFHLLVYGTRFLPYRLLARVWYRIVGSGDVKHLLAGTSVEAIRSRRGVMSYASKRYMGKEWDSELALGRCWGVLNRSSLPLSERRRLFLSVEVANRVFRVVRKHAKLDVRTCYNVFSDAPSTWERFVIQAGGVDSG